MKLMSTRLRVRLRLLKYFIFKVYSFRYNFASEEYSTTALQCMIQMESKCQETTQSQTVIDL